MRAKHAILVVVLAAMHLLLLLAGFVAPYDPAAQNRELPYAPPTRLHFKDAAGWHLRPFVYRLTIGPDGYIEDTSQAFPIKPFARGSRYRLAGVFTTDWHLFGVDEPGTIALLGTDGFGRDEFSRVLYGGQISVAAGLAATLVALFAGTILGVISGYYGRWADESLMGATELLLSLPWLYFLLGVRAFLPLHLSPVRTFLLLTFVIGLLRRHILPQVFGILLAQATVLIPRYIAAEVTLSFFGLGVSEPVASWGNMLSALQQYSVLVSYSWMLAPLGALVVTSVIYSLLADALYSRLEFHST